MASKQIDTVTMVANRNFYNASGRVKKGDTFKVSEREASAIERAASPLAKRAEQKAAKKTSAKKSSE